MSEEREQYGLNPVRDSVIIATPPREYWLAVRQALLMQIDAIERMLGIYPTTGELRRQFKLAELNK